MDLESVCSTLLTLPSAGSRELDSNDKLVVYESLINNYVLKLPDHCRMHAMLNARAALSRSESLRKMLDDILSGKC